MDLLASKLVAMLILGMVSLALGILAVGLRRILGLTSEQPRRKQVLLTSLLLCFGAGVLLSTAMLHILPEVREGLSASQESLGVEWLAELVVCAGFFLIYLVEESVHLTLHSTSHTEQLHRSLSLRRTGVVSPEDPDSACNNQPTTSSCCNSPKASSGCHNDLEMEAGERGSTDSAAGNNYNPKYQVRLSLTTSSMFPNYQAPDSLPPGQTKEKRRLSHSHLLPGQSSSSPVRDFFTVLALSFHAVFEGLAVGLEEENEDVWAMFAAIATHKFVITFCVSLELLQAGISSLGFGLYLVTFSLVSPLGIGVGLAVSELSDPGTQVHQVTVAVLQGLAGGTIIYVVMFEVLQREKSRDVPGLLQLLGIVTGFLVMLLIEFFGHHDHHDETDIRRQMPSLLEEDLGSPLVSLFNSSLPSIANSTGFI